MLLAASKLVLFLILAAAIGAIAAWWFARNIGRRDVEAAERRAREAMTSVHADLQTRETKLRDLRTKMSDAETRITGLERENAHLSTRRSTSSIVDDEKARIIRSLNDELNTLRRQSEHIESGVIAWRKHSEAVHVTELEKLTQQLESVTRERDQLHAELGAARVDINSAANTIVELQPLHAKLQTAAARVNELEGMLAHHRTEQERLQHELGVLAKVRDGAQAREADITQLKSQLNDARSDLGAARQQLSQLAELQAQLNQAAQRLRAAEMDVQGRDREIEKLRHSHLQVERIAQRVPELERVSGDLQAQLARANNTVQASEKEVKARIEDLTRLRTELIQGSVASKRLPELERQLAEAQLQHTRDESRLRSLENALNAASEELATVRPQLQTLSATAARVPDLDRNLTQSVERHTRDQQRIEALEAEASAHDQTLVRMQTDLVIMQRESTRAAELERTLQELRAQVDVHTNLSQRIEQRELEVSGLTGDLAASRQALRDQEEEVAELRTNLVALEEQLSQLATAKQAAEDVRKALDDALAERSSLQRTLDQTMARVQELEMVEAQLRLVHAPSLAPDEENERQENGDAGAALESVALRNSAKDDLKRIHGVGPVLEKLLNKHGIKFFSQVAQWTKSDIERMAELMPNFRTRITRENWMKSAREEHIKKYGKAPAKD